MENIEYLSAEKDRFYLINNPHQTRTLSMTDIWRNKFEGKRITLDPSLFSD